MTWEALWLFGYGAYCGYMLRDAQPALLARMRAVRDRRRYWRIEDPTNPYLCWGRIWEE